MIQPSCSRPGVARWNFQRLVDLKQCDVITHSITHSVLLYNYFNLRKFLLSLLDLTSLLRQPQSSQLKSSAPAPATPATTGDTDLPPPAVQLQSQQSSAVVFNLPAAPVPTTMAMKGDTIEETQMDTDLPCTPPVPDRLISEKAEMGG